MVGLQKIKRALVSVSNKDGVVDLANFLINSDVEIISTGGTAKLLSQNGIDVKDISDFTGFPEIMDGRVKTLHPKVHGALLGVLDNDSHRRQALENDIGIIDLVIVNLYPFVETCNKGSSYEEVVENIDIGGPSMIRSAAKNHAYKVVVTNSDDYKILVRQMEANNGSTDLDFRKLMACKAFTLTANYDQAISSYFSGHLNIVFPERLIQPCTLKNELRYGENSHQRAAVYKDDFNLFGIVNSKQLQGKELSYNNFNDADAAFNAILEFDKPACVIVKHANPCGVAISGDIKESYLMALKSDSKSAFGGIVALNKEVDVALASEVVKMFYEVVIATSFSKEAIAILSKKKNLRLLEVKMVGGSKVHFKSISGGVLVQDLDNKSLTISDLKHVSNKKATDGQIKELLFSMAICKHVKSNAIVITKDFCTVGIGCGQTSRVDSVEIACKKVGDVSDSVLASDAFFPFSDGLEYAIKNGVKAVIAPCGSIRDQEVIDVANKYDIALCFIESRHFRH